MKHHLMSSKNFSSNREKNYNALFDEQSILAIINYHSHVKKFIWFDCFIKDNNLLVYSRLVINSHLLTDR